MHGRADRGHGCGGRERGIWIWLWIGRFEAEAETGRSGGTSKIQLREGGGFRRSAFNFNVQLQYSIGIAYSIMRGWTCMHAAWTACARWFPGCFLSCFARTRIGLDRLVVRLRLRDAQMQTMHYPDPSYGSSVEIYHWQRRRGTLCREYADGDR